MKELKMNLQGSWRRVLAMITVAAMCFSVVSISPAFATDEPANQNVNTGVTFQATTDSENVEITVPAADTKIAVGGEINRAGTASVTGYQDEGAAEYTVEWSCSKADDGGDIATIDENTGKLTAVKEGETTITLTVKKGDTTVGEAATAKLTVVPATVPLKGVAFSMAEADAEPVVAITAPEKAEVTVDGELQLAGTATVLAADYPALDTYTVAWASEDEEKATVDENGKVTGVAEGEANITLEVKKGDDPVGEKQTRKITVTPKSQEPPTDPEKPENPDVSPAEVVTTVEAVKVKAATELTVGGTEKLTAEVTVSPADATKPVAAWKSSNDKVATVATDGTVKAIAEGTANITATATIGESTATGTCVVTVKAAANTNPGTSTTKPSDSTTKPATSTTLKPGTKKTVNGVTYKVEKQKNTVTYQKPKKNAKNVTIPATVKINGETYKVTSVANNAFKGNKKVKTIKVGKNVTTIGAGAFQNCKALTKVTLPAKTKTIGKNAFANSKKLKKIVIKSTKMTKKTIKNGAFKKVSKKVTVDVPNKKAKTYKKLFQKKGLPKACKVK